MLFHLCMTLYADARKPYGLIRKIEGWSIIDRNNITLHKKIMTGLAAQSKNLYPVINNHYWGAVSANGEEIVHCVFDSLVEITKPFGSVNLKISTASSMPVKIGSVAPQTLPIHLINNQLVCAETSHRIFS